MSSGKIIGCFILLLVLIHGKALGQPSCYRVVFYNAENLFDTRDDSLTADDDFTPRGKMYWTKKRYHRKLLHTAKSLLASGGDRFPAIIGLAEVENQQVLFDLTQKTGLAGGNYGIIHNDSPDPRGIDVALLYRKEVFRELTRAFFPVALPRETTRDILYGKGILEERDTLHFFVCHFPSMRGGEAKSEWKRIEAASVLKRKVDSIQRHSPGAMIVIMGDLNGCANTRAQQVLKVKDPGEQGIIPRDLYNTGYYLLDKSRGSYRFKGVWQSLDHVIVSGTLLDGKGGWRSSARMGIADPEFLLEEEKGTFGKRPKPTYRGRKYIGGYSDHLPVFIDLSHSTNIIDSLRIP